MARAPDKRVHKALELYKQGLKLVEIASQLSIPEGTVRSWKNRYKWDEENNATLQKEKRNVAKKATPKKEPIVDEVKSVLENTELTDKQRLFCLHYIKCFNATKAYQKAYGVDYNTAASISYRLLDNDGIRDEINRLKQGRFNRVMFNEMDLFQMYLDIATADITDFVEFGREEVPVMNMFGPVEVEDEDTGEKIPVTKIVNTVKFKESTDVDGFLISEVKQGRDGASIKLQDKMKAMDWLDKHMGLATEEQRLRISKLKYEVSQLSGGNEGDTSIKDFLKATKPTDEDMKELFADEEVIVDGEED